MPECAAQIGGSARVLLAFSITQRDAAYRRGPTPAVGSVRRDWFGGRRPGEMPVDAASEQPARWLDSA